MALLGSLLSYGLNQWLCRWTGQFRAQPPARPTFAYTSDYQIRTLGDCNQGTYVQIYCPTTPYLGGNQTAKAVIYLHGFDLGPAQIYQAHLLHLVRQGIYVIYPNYQQGFCQFPPRPWLTVEALIRETVGSGVIHPQRQWMQSALLGAQRAYTLLGWDTAAVDTYLYGHSLGGLFALSWPYFLQQGGFPEALWPRQVLAADPVPNTGRHARSRLGRQMGAFVDAIDIEQTGVALTMPTAILHGNDDAIAPKEEWRDPFRAIATAHKKMYVSFSDVWGCPALWANHEQSTVDTRFLGTLLALTILDGVGVEDALDWFYLWSALDQVVMQGRRADQLTFDMGTWSDGRPVRPVEVFLEP
ncbi:MAG: alpha/beta hydrolase fold domain-containing protein [Synechococcales cyanobacterium]